MLCNSREHRAATLAPFQTLSSILFKLEKLLPLKYIICLKQNFGKSDNTAKGKKQADRPGIVSSPSPALPSLLNSPIRRVETCFLVSKNVSDSLDQKLCKRCSFVNFGLFCRTHQSPYLSGAPSQLTTDSLVNLIINMTFSNILITTITISVVANK